MGTLLQYMIQITREKIVTNTKQKIKKQPNFIETTKSVVEKKYKTFKKFFFSFNHFSLALCSASSNPSFVIVYNKMWCDPLRIHPLKNQFPPRNRNNDTEI